MSESASVTILYTNWRGETAVRRISPWDRASRLWFGSTEWHPEPQWLLSARDVEKDALRDWPLSGIKAWGEEAVSAALASTAGDGAGDWQPIETAPKDGTRILVIRQAGGGNRFVEVSAWRRDTFDRYHWSLNGDHQRSWHPAVAWQPMPAVEGQSPAVPASPRSGAGRSERAVEIRELSEKATQGEWTVGKGCILAASTNPCVPGQDVVVSAAYSDRSHDQDAANLQFIRALVAAYRSGELVNRSEIAGRSEKGAGDGLKRDPSGPGSREPSPSVSASGFDPSRTEQALHLSDGDDIWPPARTVAYVQRELQRIAQDLNAVGEDLTDEQPKANSWLDVACGRVRNCISVLKGVEQRLAEPAQAIEAHRAETQSGSVADESAVHGVDAPGPSEPAPAQSPSTSEQEG